MKLASNTNAVETSAVPPVTRRASRRTRWWTYVAGILCLAVAWPLLRYNLSSSRWQQAQSFLESGDPAAAIRLLEVEQRAAPQSADIEYWLAVAHRRAGHISVFKEHLKRAQDLGYRQDEIERQVFLSRIQLAMFSPELEQQAERLIQDSDKYSGSRMDLFVDEFYEARAQGYVANYRLEDAALAANHWVAARPDSIPARMLRADIHEREVKFPEAERDYLEILARAPNNVEARLELARLLKTRFKCEEAAEDYRLCLQIAPEEIQAKIGLAECEFRSKGGAGAARERLLKVLDEKLTPKDRASALFLLGEIARSEKHNDLVVKYLTEALQLAPTLEPGPYRILYAAHASLNHRDEAEKYKKVFQEKMDRNTKLFAVATKIREAPENAALRFEQGNNFLEDGQKDEAAAWWNMAVRFDPQFQAAHEALAGYYAAKGDQERTDHHRRLAEKSARATFNKVWLKLLNSNTQAVRDELPNLARYPSLREPVELLTLGLNVVERKDIEESAAGLGRLASNPVLRPRALTLLAEALYEMGHYNAAERACHEVLAASPRNIIAHKRLQAIYFDLGAYEKMEFHALEVSKLDPTDYRPHRHLGFLSHEAENWDEAILAYKESLRRDPKQPTREEVLLELANCYVEVLKHQEALDTLKDAPPSAQKSFIEAKCLFATKKVSAAKKLLDESLESTPDHARTLLLRSDIALAEGDAAGARAFLERAVKEVPYDNSAHLKLGIVLLRLNESEAAKKEADRAKELLGLNLRLSELHSKASHREKDIGIRREMAALARQLGREEEALRWERAVEGMTDDPVLDSKLLAVPLKPLEFDQGNPIPVVRKSGPQVGPQPAPKVQGPEVRQPRDGARGPKACGEEPAVAEKTREQPAKEELPAARVEDKKEEVFSGPQKEEVLPGFTLKISGEAEKELDVVKEAGGKPTLIVFVHTVTRPSVNLARILGDYAATRKKDGLHVGVAFLTADATETKSWIKRAVGALPKNVPLGIADGGQEGPGAYGLNRNVAMTILVAKEGKVTANFALVQPSLQADGPKILKEIVEALGGGKVPSIEELSKPPEMRRERGKQLEKKDGEKKSKRDGE